MKSIKILCLSLFLAAGAAFAPAVWSSSMAVPSGQHVFPSYGPMTLPVVSTDPARAMPIGLGSAATGGTTVTLQIGIGEFSGPVDIYVGIYAPAINPDYIYILMPDNVTLQHVPLNSLTPNGTFQLSSVTFSPWMANTSGNFDEKVLRSMAVSSLPQGTYSLYLLVTPAGSLSSYYLWKTTALFGDNVVPVTVNGALCAPGSYENKPCVSVTVCSPGTSACQTIDDVLLDTGSTGLRIFKQALHITLDQVTGSTGSLAECIHFGDGSADWGPVQTADVILGNEPAVRVPIQVIDAAFGLPPAACSNADSSPEEAGYTGILGIGPLAEDCGPTCSRLRTNGMYYACSGSGCQATTVALSDQVPNPVALLPLDNNGLMVRLPGVLPDGSPSSSGYFVLGVGTRANNTPSGVITYATDQFGNIGTSFDGSLYTSFIDTGSNGLFFPPPSSGLLPSCALPNRGWFCPPSIADLSAINMGAFGPSAGSVAFQIGDFISLLNSSNRAFSNIGGDEPGDFDWGLPFFFGKDVFLGIEGTASGLGSGPYWAY
ncbi:MAG: DUF3443 domain-containing protein [Thermodesulfovibrionales bacterium]